MQLALFACGGVGVLRREWTPSAARRASHFAAYVPVRTREVPETRHAAPLPDSNALEDDKDASALGRVATRVS